MKLTKKTIDNTPLPEKGQRFLWDSEPRGFGLRLTPTKKTYVIQGRVHGKKTERRVSLGEHGVLTVNEARKIARRELSAMLEGKDPIKEKQRIEARAVTLEQVVDAYLKDRRSLKELSRADILKHLKRSFTDWQKIPITSITRDMVLTRFRELTDKGPTQANQAFRILRALFNYAMGAYRADGESIIKENPVKAISDLKIWNDIKPRSGRIPTGKIGIAWNTLQAIRQSEGETIIRHTLTDAVSFLLLTGARWNEMAALTWDRVNLDEGWWFIPDPKNRTSVTFPLSNAVTEILRERPKINQWVFPGRLGNGPVHEARGIFLKVSEAVGVPVTAHDMRRTFRAIAGECGVDFWKTKLLMGHKLSGDITITHYTETSDLRYLEKDINKIAEWILQQGVIASSDKVIQFPSGKRVLS